MRKTLTLALGRHGGTEVAGSGASPGTLWLFSSLEHTLQRHVSVLRVPPYYPLDARGSLRIAIDVLNEADAFLFGPPRHPTDFDAFFAVRSRMQRPVPFLYLPLGEFPRGAWFYRHLFRHFGANDVLLFSSTADRAVFDLLVTSTPAHAVVVPFGVKQERFRVAPQVRVTVRRHLGIAPHEVVFIYHGRVTEAKNVHALIAILRDLIFLGLPVRLWLVGPVDGDPAPGSGPRSVAQLPSTPLFRLFTRLLPTPALRDRVSVWGAMSPEALPELLSAADVGINLTLNPDENFGYGIVEAMAAGLPVVGSDWGGLKDTIVEGLTGYRVPTVITPAGVGLDLWRARQCAIALVTDAKRRARMGRAAAHRVSAALTLDRFGDAVAEQVMAQVRAPPPASPVRHEWTALGQRLVDTYSAPLAEGPFGSLPMPVRPAINLFAEYPLMRQVLEPYASVVHAQSPGIDGMFFLATQLFTLHGTQYRSGDPRYPLCTELGEPIDRALVRLLSRHGFVAGPALAKQMARRFKRQAITAALARLLQSGIVMQSEAAATIVPAAVALYGGVGESTPVHAR